MPRFLLRRLLHTLFVVWGVVTAVFFLVRLTGDPTALLVDPSATQEEIAHTRHLLGLDRPWHVQYVDFLFAMLRGDFGQSIQQRRPAMQLVLEHLWPATVELAVAATVLSTLLAIPLGIVAATHQNRAPDHLSRLASLFLQSMPSFWLGLVLILVFAVQLNGLLPAYGTGTWRHLMLPERLILYRHAIWNTAIPFLTVTGLSVGFMLSGAIVIETVFSWPGLGRLIVQAIPGRDFPVIQAGVFVFALIFVLVNLAVDLLYAVVDPRVRLS